MRARLVDQIVVDRLKKKAAKFKQNKTPNVFLTGQAIENTLKDLSLWEDDKETPLHRQRQQGHKK